MDNNWIDLSKLPRKNNKIDWKKCSNIEVGFKYDDIFDKITIIKWIDNKHILIKYKGKEHICNINSFRRCNLGFIVGKYSRDYYFKINEIIQNDNNKLKIKDQIKIKRKQCFDKGYIVECQTCGYIYQIVESSLRKNIENNNYMLCSCCSNKVVVKGINDMWTTSPWQAQLLLNKNDGYQYMHSSIKEKLKWECPHCNNIIEKTPHDVYEAKGLRCQNCSETMSYPNKFMYTLLKEMGVFFIAEKYFDWSKNKKYDFYLPKFNLIIEMHGIQHYEQCGLHKFTTLEEIQLNDKLKNDLATMHDIENYVVVDCMKSDFSYIKQNILNSKLYNMLDFSNINWLRIFELIEPPLIFEVAKIWNEETHDVSLIKEKMNLHPKKICSMLKRAASIGICDYTPEESQANGRKKMLQTRYQIYSKPFMCIDTNECFGNMTIYKDVCNKRNEVITTKSVRKVLDGKSIQYKGHTYCYITKNDFNNIKKDNSNNVYGDYFEEGALNYVS